MAKIRATQLSKTRLSRSLKDEDKTERVYSRNFSSSTAERMALSTPSYVMSTRGSFDHYKKFAINEAKSAVAELKDSAAMERLKQHLYILNAAEIEKAEKIVKEIGADQTGDAAKKYVLNIFQSGMNLAPQEISVESILYSVFQDAFDNIDTSSMAKANSSFVRNVKRRQKDIQKHQQTIELLLNELEQFDFTSLMTSSAKEKFAPIYTAYKKIRTLVDPTDSLVDLLITGKGTLQDMIDFIYISKQIVGLNTDAKLDLVGAVAVDKIKENLTGTLLSQARQKSNAAGITSKGVESDLIVTFGATKIGLSIKSTVDSGKDGNRLKYNTSKNMNFQQNLGEMVTKSNTIRTEGIYRSIRFGLVTLMSSFNLGNENVSYFINDQVLRPLAFATIRDDSFLAEYFLKNVFDSDSNSFKDLRNDPEFHHLLIINNKVFWFSDILKTTIEDLSNYDAEIYKRILSAENINEIGSRLGMLSNKLYYRKLTVLKQKAIKNEKDYGVRLEYLLKDPKILDMLKQYNSAINSLSIRVSVSNFRVGNL